MPELTPAQITQNEYDSVNSAKRVVVVSSGSGASSNQVQGTAADNAARVGNPVLTGIGYNATLPTYDDGDVVIPQGGTRGSQNVTLMVQNSTSPLQVQATNADGVATSATTSRLEMVARNSRFNGTSYDRDYGNNEATLLASAARAVTTNTTDQTNFNGRGVMLLLSVTVEAATETLSLKIQAKDPISGSYGDYVDFGVVYNATTMAPGVFLAVAYPGLLTADLISGAVGKAAPLPRTWRAVVTHSSSGNWTYSLASSVVN